MFASLLVWDDANRGEVEEVLSSEKQVRDRITALDGRSRTLVTVYGGDAHLTVGGDSATGLVVYATFDNKVFHQLATDTDNDGGEVTVVAGGQPGRYAASCVVQLDDAVTAAEVFAREGRLAEGLLWVER
jgi:Immunity protein Imm1